MVGKNKIFVDSNYLVALYSKQDKLHENAVELEKKMIVLDADIVLSNFIFLETVKVLSQKVGKRMAVTVGTHLLTDSGFDIIHIDELLHNHSWRIFQNMDGKNISFVDCSIIATMLSSDIDTLLTFDDKNFRQLQKQYRFRLFSQGGMPEPG